MGVTRPGLGLGLGLSASTGVASGTPNTAGSYNFTVRVQDSIGSRVEKNFQLLVNPASGNPVPVIGDIAPGNITQGSGGTVLRVYGQNFVASSVVLLNVTEVPLATTFVSSTELSAIIPAAQLQTVGSRPVRVSNPAPGGGKTPASQVVILAGTQNPLPTLTSLSPGQVNVGAGNTQITLIGTNFIAATQASLGAQGLRRMAAR